MKNKKNIMFGLLAMLVFTFGIVNFANANTYDFINTSGQRVSVVANSPEEALRTANNLGVHSGVILVNTNTQTTNQTTDGQGLYLYDFINTSGQRVSVMADSPEEALRTAYNLGVHSGVILVQ